ncbi:MAG TPA: ABC transporter permease, partial [Actinopolymorphaceae bacterium]
MSTPPLSFGQAASLVARREIGQRLRDRSFLVSTIITLVILGVVLMLPKFLGGDAPRVAFGGDRASAMASAAEATARQFDLDLEVSASPDEATAKRALTDGDLTAYVTGEKIFVQEDLDARLGAVLQQAHRQVEGNARLRAAGIDPAEVQAASAVPPLAVEAADPVDPMAEQRGQIAFIGSIVLYGQIIGYCMWVAFGVVEEKSSRVIELILSAVSSKALL